MNRFVKKYNMALLFPLLCMLVLFPLRASAREYACSVSLPVRIVLTGTVDADFTVGIAAEEEAPLPEETTVTIRGSGEASFGAISYTEPGNYRYTITQQDSNLPYLTCDDTVYHLTVRVVNDDEGGLVSEIWATRDDQTEKTAELVFANTYNPPTPPAGTGQTPAPGTEADQGAGGSGQNSGAGQPSASGQGETAAAVSAPSAVSSLLQQLSIPQTGDQFPLVLLVVVLCAAAAGFVYSYYRKRHPKKGGPDSSSGADR